MNEYRLAALDMDGTLLNTAHELTPYTREALRRASAAGRIMALCTGRCLSEIRPLLPMLDGVQYAIGINGARLYDLRTQAAMMSVNLSADDAAWILDEAMRYDACRQIILGDQSYHDFARGERLTRCRLDGFAGVFEAGSICVDDLEALRREQPDRVAKINVFLADPADQPRFEAGLARHTRAVFFDAIVPGVEICAAGATKAQGLRALCARLGVPIEQTMAVGDGGNDLDVMRAAAFSVAMGNAVEPVRAAAHAVTDDCDHDGAAKAIERWMGV